MLLLPKLGRGRPAEPVNVLPDRLCAVEADGRANRHRGADQWLYVVSGTGVAVVNGERVELRGGTLVLIQRGDRHEIRNTGDSPLKTLNVYVPPAYTEDGEELPATKP